MLGFSCFASVFLVILNLSSSLPTTKKSFACPLQTAPSTPSIFLTLSSIYSSTTPTGVVQRQLEINWTGGGTFQQNDRIAIYRQDPTKVVSEPVDSFDPSDYPGGYVKSGVQIPVRMFGVEDIHGDPCLGYWVAHLNENNETLSSSCLQIQPKWMQNIGKHIRHLSLDELMIPGSHDSGSFSFHREMEPLSKYKYAQEESVLGQLIYGLRYFDLRVGYYPDTKQKYFINHNFLRTEHSVESVLQQVHSFLKSTKEIVILDFHNFPIGFKTLAPHGDLIRMIVEMFERFLVPYKAEYQSASLETLWRSGKRLLVSYDSPARDTADFGELLWPRIPRAWGNKQKPDDLKSYFKTIFERDTPSGQLWASMAELTPNARTIVLHPETGLRYFAELINKNVTHWFRDLYWHKANIVATDFFLGNNIIDVAIKSNTVKGSCPKSVWSQLRL